MAFLLARGPPEDELMYALRTTHYRQTLLAVLTGLTTLPAASPLLSQVRIDTIALTGQEAPGFEPARFSGYIDGNWNSGFSEHRKPYINNSGQVLFGGQAYSYPLGDLYDDGVWATEQDDQLRLVRRERMAAPGTNFEFGECNDFDENNFCRRQHPDDSMQILGLSDAGEAVFSSSLVGPDVNVMNYQGTPMTRVMSSSALI